MKQVLANYEIQQQILTNWCWAAVSSSVSFYYDDLSIWRQNKVAGAILGSRCAHIDDVNDTVPNGCNTMADLSVALATTHNLVEPVIQEPITFNEIAAQLSGLWPICCQMQWPGHNRSHFVTIFGYENQYLYIGDPDAGLITVSYSEFRINYRKAGRWIRTILTTPAY